MRVLDEQRATINTAIEELETDTSQWFATCLLNRNNHQPLSTWPHNRSKGGFLCASAQRVRFKAPTATGSETAEK